MKCNVAIIIICCITAISLLVNACRKSGVKFYPAPEKITLHLPEGFPSPTYSFENNPLTRQGVRLGRVLFYDENLSGFNDVNCGSCHQQMAGFTQFDHDLGHGTGFQHTTRNPPGIFNMIWQQSYKWDGSVTGLPSMVESCLTASEKMGESYDGIIRKINSSARYKELFGEAFGDDNISGNRIRDAITQFVATIISADSKYDQFKRGEVSFNESEQQGYALFQSKCASCHQEPLFTDHSFRNIGLAISPFNTDYGRMEFTGVTSDALKFKVPSLRNVAVSGYYAHDGRFQGITEMLDHYSENTGESPTLDPSLVDGIPLNNLEKFYLLEFLQTLTDNTMLHNPDFGPEE